MNILKHTIVMIFTVIFFFLLQSTLLQYVSFGGIIPNLMIIITASYGFMMGEKSGLLIGFFSGLLVDIFFGSVLGFYAIILMYIGFVNGTFTRIFFPEDIKLPLILIFFSDFIYNLVCYIFLFLINGRMAFGTYFLKIIFPEMIYTIVVACILYPIILKINQKLVNTEKEGVKKIGKT